jgi:carboxypeptidase family protein
MMFKCFRFVAGAGPFTQLLALMLVLMLFVHQVAAQGGTYLRGMVEDPSTAAVAGAELTLINKATGETRTTESDDNGRFLFENVAPGGYILKAQADEFRPFEKDVTIGADSLEVSVKLKIASEEQQVTVTANQDRVLPEDNADAVKVNDQLIRELPMESQDILSVLSNFLSLATIGAEGVSLVVDGVEVNELDTPTWSIKDVVINQSPYSAEFRRPGKSRIEVTTRQPSRRYFHGGISYYARNSTLDARNFFAQQKPDLDRRLWEGGLSGPLVGRRATFFLSGSHLEDDEEMVVNAFTPGGQVVKNVPTHLDRTNLLGRLDFYPNKVHKITALYTLNLQFGSNQGVSGFLLPEQGNGGQEHLHRIEISDQAVVSSNLLNILRLVAKRKTQSAGAPADMPKIVVNGAFTGGPSSTFRRDRETVAELDDTVSYSRGMHTLRFGGTSRAKILNIFDASNFTGTFEFASLADFNNQTPYVFRMNEGQPNASFVEYEANGFFQDELRIRPDFSMLLGLRYDWQSALDDRKDFAPRISLAFAPGKQKTVFRAGAGIFYDRLPGSVIDRAMLFQVLRMKEVVILDPPYPDPFATGANPPPSFFRISPGTRAPYLLDASLGIEQQLWKAAQLTVEGQSLRGVHLFRSRNVNAPLPLTGLPPDPNFTNIDQLESSATLRGNALNVSFRGQIGKRFHGMAQYTFSHMINDVSGVFSLPANNYDLRPEQSRAEFDRRHRFSFVGSLNLPAGFRFGAVLAVSTGPPFNITTGADNNHDSVATDRPAGVGRNTGQGPDLLQLDLRFGKSLRFPRPANRERTSRNLEFNVDAFNILNRTNFNNFVGVQSSPFFGRANSALPPRLVQLSVRYHF